MSKRMYPFVATLVALLLVGCQDRRPAPVDPASQDPLWASYIVSHTSGLVSKAASVRVRFAEDVVDESLIGTSASDVFSIDPPAPGSVTFSQRREIVLVPDEELASGERYVVTVRRRGLAGIPERLDAYAFEFRIIPQEFEIEVHGLRASSAGDGSMVLGGTLRTADVEDPEPIEQMLTARFLDEERPLSWRHSGDGRGHEFEVTELTRQARAEIVHLRWDAASIGLDDRGERDVTLPPEGVFEVTRVQTVREDDPYVEVYFTDRLDTSQNLSGLVRLGDIEPRLRVDGNVLRVYPQPGIEGAIELRLDAAIRNVDGDRLSESLSRSVAIERLRPQVRFAGRGVILPDHPVLSIPFEAVGVRSVRVAAFQVFEDNIGQFLQTNQLDGGRELGRVGRYLWQRNIPLSAAEPNGWNRYSLDATELFEEHPGGLFRLTLSISRADATESCPDAPEPPQDEPPPANYEDLWVEEASNWSYAEDYYGQGGDGSTWRDRGNPCKDAYYRYGDGVRDERNFLASNIGLLAKREPEGRLLVIATDLSTSRPLSGTELTVHNFQNRPVRTARTDASGFAELELDGQPFYVVATRGDDRAYLKLSKGSALPVSHLDVGGESVTDGIKGFIYGERGVWRPGDELFLTFVLEDDGGRIPEDHPVTLELIDPRGQVASTQTNASPVGRFYAFAMKTDDAAPTGSWTARARIGGARFTKRLRIETVMPNRLKVELDFGRDTLRKSDMPLQASLFGQWLTGATAGGLDADVQARLTPVPTRFDRNTDYVFDDPARTFQSEPETLFEGALDAEGRVSFDARLDAGNDAPGMLRASLSSRVFERGGAFSISRSSVPFSPYDRYVGIKVPKGDATRNMLLTDVDHTVAIATVDADGAPVAVDELQVSLYKIHWRWWWDKSGDALAQYANRAHTGVIASDTVTTVDGGGQWQFRIDYPEWGRYLLRVCDTTGGHCTGQVFYVDWPGWAGRAQEQSGPGANTLTFTADQPSYRVGDTASLQLPEVSAGRALFTIESGSRILEARWVEPDGEPITFRVTEAMSPNVYASLTLVQPHAEKDNDRPIRLYGTLPILVEDPKTRLAPRLEAPEEWAPESTATIRVAESEGRSMDYTVAIVDEGLLGLTGFRTPDLHGHFYQREALGITTWDLFDDVVGAYGGELERLLALGGGGGGDVEPESERKRFPPVVTFLGPFELEPGATNEHRFDLPKYVGAVRVMVVAGRDGAYGSADQSVFVRQPLMILPTLSRVVGPGETLKVPVSTFVMDPSIRDVRLSIDTDDGLSVRGPDSLSLSFSGAEEKMGFFELEAGSALGTNVVRVNATSGPHRASAEVALDVRSPNPPTLRSTRVELAPGETWEPVIEPHGIAGTNRTTLEVSAVPPLDLERRLDYLIRYPHGCVEQTTSAAFPQLFVPRLTTLDERRREELENNVHAAIARLRGFQVPGGGFAYWPSAYWSASIRNHWSTSYVGHFLVEAERLGYRVPPAMMSDWVNHQKSVARGWTGGTEDSALDQAYRLYTLALADQPELGAMNRLREASSLPPVARWQLAAAYARAGQPDAGENLVRGLAFRMTHDGRQDGTFGSALRNDAIVLASLGMLPSRRADASDLAEDVSRELTSSRWYSTQSVAYALMALARFAGDADVGTPSFDIALGGAPARAVPLDVLVHTETLTGVADDATELRLTNTSDTTLFVGVTTRGTPPPGEERASARGLRLAVDYRDPDGRTVDVSSLESGTDFIATIEVTNRSGSRWENLALTQILPSGWEILNTRLDQPADGAAPVAPESEVEYEDIRDDRLHRYFALDDGETKRFVTVLNAAYSGRFYQPGVSVEAMYDARTQARVEGQWVVVEDPAR